MKMPERIESAMFAPCGIKDCVTGRQLAYCFECSEYPCRQIKRLEKSYNTRYHASLTENSRTVKEKGIHAFPEQQKEKFTCPECGGCISVHDAECSECGRKIICFLT